MTVRLVERTKRCGGCGEMKPWSDFHAYKRWEDGTMRLPQSWCKECDKERQRRVRREQPERHRERCKRWRERKKLTDPNFLAREAERQRLHHAMKAAEAGREYRPARPLEYKPTLGTGRRLSIEPFRCHLTNVMEARKWTHADLAQAIVGEAMNLESATRAIFRWFGDPQTVEVREDSVDWVLTQIGEQFMLRELYPHGDEMAA